MDDIEVDSLEDWLQKYDFLNEVLQERGAAWIEETLKRLLLAHRGVFKSIRLDIKPFPLPGFSTRATLQNTAQYDAAPEEITFDGVMDVTQPDLVAATRSLTLFHERIGRVIGASRLLRLFPKKSLVVSLLAVEP